jgi:hypothetical protein
LNWTPSKKGFETTQFNNSFPPKISLNEEGLLKLFDIKNNKINEKMREARRLPNVINHQF